MTINVNCPPRGLFIGHETENGARALTVDFSAWAAEYSTGTLQILFQRPGTESPYAVVLTRDGTTATWKPSETDLAEAGTGAVQIIYTVGDVRVKTSIIPVMVEPSLGVETDPPDGWTSWIDQLTDLAAVTEQHAASAAESAENAGDSATDAQRYATDAGDAKNAAVAAAEAAAASASHYPQIVNGVWYVWSPSAGAYISTGIDAQGEDGVSPTVEITAIQGGHRVVITDAEGSHTFDVMDGVTPDLSAYRTAADQDEIDDAQDEELNNLKSAINAKAGIIRDTVNGAVASFVPDASVENLLGLTVDIEPVQAGSGDPSPDNVRPISGRESVEVEAAGVNLWDKSNVQIGYIDNSNGAIVPNANYRNTGFIKVAPGAQYYVATEQTNGLWAAWYDKSQAFVSGFTSYSNSVITAPPSAEYVALTVLSNTSGNIDTFALNYPSTDHAYHPYAGNRYTIALGDTVYGGTLDVTNGTLTVTYAEYVFTGNEAWQASSTPNRFFVNNMNQYLPYNMAAQPMVANAKQNVISSIFGTFAYKNADGVGYIVTGSNELKQLVVNTTAATTVADINTIMTGSQLAYELETPIVIDLDPVTIATIAGQTNNVWADAGDVAVEYAADLKHYIDSKIAAAVAALS